MKKHKAPHAQLAIAMVEEIAADSQCDYSSAEENEMQNIISRHGGVDADGFVPHDLYDHCEICCEFESCEEKA